MILAAALCSLLAPLQMGCGHETAPRTSPAPSDIHLATSPPAEHPYPPAAGVTRVSRLAAIATVRRYCRLIDSGRLGRAAALYSHRGAWRRRELAALHRFRLRTIRVWGAPSARTITLIARVHVGAGRGSSLSDGPNTLFFTLGRVGAMPGTWLITAMTTSP